MDIGLAQVSKKEMDCRFSFCCFLVIFTPLKEEIYWNLI